MPRVRPGRLAAERDRAADWGMSPFHYPRVGFALCTASALVALDASNTAAQPAASAAPPAAYSVGSAFDVDRGRLVIFGGFVRGTYAGNTWEWDGRAWTLMTSEGPSARNSPAMVYDAARRQVVMFGGDTRTTGALGDTWVYDGEKFVDGVYKVACAACGEVVFSADVCPRCHAPGGLERALRTPNRWPVPSACPSCDDDQVRYVAFVPARVVYEDKRADKARTSTELHEDGFHGYRTDCRDCGTVAALVDACPLCDAPAPLRARPG